MRSIHRLLVNGIAAFYVAAPLTAQTTTISGTGGSVTTTANSTTGIIATAASGAPDVTIQTGNNTTSAFRVFNPASELLRVQANGYVGIGTSNPTSKLTLFDAANSLTGQRLAVGLSDGYAYTIGRNPNTGFLEFIGTNEAGSQFLGYNFNARVGIGTSAGYLARVTIYDSGNSTTGQRLALGYIDGYNYTLGRNPNTGYLDFIGTNDAGSQYIGYTFNSKVGIGTNSPAYTLQIGSTYPVTVQDIASAGGVAGQLLNMTGSSEIHVAGLQFGKAALPVIQSIPDPSGVIAAPLYVNTYSNNDVIIGDAAYTGTGLKVLSRGPSSFAGSMSVGGALSVTGNVQVTGTITGAAVIGATYQDVAEWVPASVNMDPGTVVVLNRQRRNEVTPSEHAYDIAVAGVVSERPGVLLGVAGPTKAEIATTGRVKVHVDATSAPIAIGDLLVTSEKAGTAMRSEPIDIGGVKIHRPGTVIGKALEPLDKGSGDILVLLSLQ
jgi:hypothetical protein